MRTQSLICWLCFQRDDHFSPNCTFDFKQPLGVDLLCSRYDNLSLEEKSKVPPHSYWVAKGILTDHNRNFTGQLIFSSERMKPLLGSNAATQDAPYRSEDPPKVLARPREDQGKA